MKISKTEEQQLKNLEVEQNKAVFALGVVTIQFEESQKKLQLEKDKIIAQILMTETKQKSLGEMILGNHGLNIKGRDFQIQNGVIMELKAINGKPEFVEVGEK